MVDSRLNPKGLVPRAVVCSCLLILSHSACTGGSESVFAGEFVGDGVSLALQADGEELEGTLEVNGQTYLVVAEAAGASLTGTFGSEDDSFELSATHEDGELTLRSGGATYKLISSSAAANPLAKNPAANPLAGDEVPTQAEEGPRDRPKASARQVDPKPQQNNASFDGNYTGVGDAASAGLILSQDGKRLRGMLMVDGVSYSIQAKVSGSSARGQVVDPTSGGSQPCRVKLTGETVVLKLPQITSGPSSFKFRRGAAAAAPAYPTQGGYGNQYGSQNQQGYTQQAGGAGQLDPQLFGRWRRTNTMVSGGASFVSDEHVVIRPDGTYMLWSGGAAGGNANVSGVVGGGGGQSGRWRVRGDVVETSEGGPFQPYAKYVVRGNDLMLVFGNGSKEMWERR